MIAASLRDGDDLVDMLLNKEADVNAKSRFPPSSLIIRSFGNMGVAVFPC